MTNADVARAFNEIADLLEISGDDSFRVVSYRRAARTIADLTADIREIAARGELAKLPGIGKGSAEKIQELLDTGKIAVREQLARKVPVTILELLNIPNMGPKKAAFLWHTLGVDCLAALKEAIDAGRLKGLKGFGDKSIERIREGLEFLERISGRTRIGAAWPLAERFRAAVAAIKGVKRVEHAGSLRRGCETVGDLDLVCVARDGPAVVRDFTRLPGVGRILAAGDTKGSILTDGADGPAMQIDLRVVPAASFGADWQYFTGSKDHNVRLREMAVRRGWSLNEYALSEGERIIASKTEEEIYAALGLPWIPPELREDRGEFALKGTPTDLVTVEDIRGDLHMHTTASDGRATLEEMVHGAKERGYKYICITDHSQASVIAGGLKPDRLKEHVAAIREIDRRTRGIEVWAGAEVDILASGALDYSDELLAQLDWVVASNHYHLGDDREANTRRAIAALRNPHVNVLAHPTGRIINRRDASPIDIEAIARVAAECGAALEINAAHQRLDLRDAHARTAAELGAVISINCDAHHPTGFDQLRFGVLTARRAWLRRDQVLNTWPAKRVRAFVEARRNKRG